MKIHSFPRFNADAATGGGGGSEATLQGVESTTEAGAPPVEGVQIPGQTTPPAPPIATVPAAGAPAEGADKPVEKPSGAPKPDNRRGKAAPGPQAKPPAKPPATSQVAGPEAGAPTTGTEPSDARRSDAGPEAGAPTTGMAPTPPVGPKHWRNRNSGLAVERIPGTLTEIVNGQPVAFIQYREWSKDAREDAPPPVQKVELHQWAPDFEAIPVETPAT
jgi:hypothetical protein